MMDAGEKVGHVARSEGLVGVPLRVRVNSTSLANPMFLRSDVIASLYVVRPFLAQSLSGQ
jgi:hypothetical protein